MNVDSFLLIYHVEYSYSNLPLNRNKELFLLAYDKWLLTLYGRSLLTLVSLLFLLLIVGIANISSSVYFVWLHGHIPLKLLSNIYSLFGFGCSFFCRHFLCIPVQDLPMN